MNPGQFFRAILLSTVCLGASSVAAQDSVIYTVDRAPASTFRDRGTAYAPTYLITAIRGRGRSQTARAR